MHSAHPRSPNCKRKSELPRVWRRFLRLRLLLPNLHSVRLLPFALSSSQITDGRLLSK